MEKSREKKITVLIDDADIDPVTYDFEIIGNKMRWTMDFTKESDKGDPDSIRLLVVEYIKG